MAATNLLKTPEGAAAYDKLEEAIKEYFTTMWKLKGVDEPTDYIGDWALVAYYADLDDLANYGYIVEASQTGNAPPHVIRGMLHQGIKWCDASEEGFGQDDD